jgi:hypothetical protein
MKTLKIVSSFFTILMLLSLSPLKAQTTDAIVVQKMIETKNYKFVAQSLTPQRGGFRNLTSLYDLTVTEKSIVADLPFFGRAYIATMDPNDAGIKFTSTDFGYTTEKIKKGWYITIKPKDARGVSELFLTIFNNGTASLQVQNINRDAITYNGYVKSEINE